MQSRLNEFSKLAQQNDAKGMIQFINDSLEKGRKDEMKSIIALTRLNVGGKTSNACINIYQYAVVFSNELLDVLKKHSLIPASFYKSGELPANVVEHLSYHFIEPYTREFNKLAQQNDTKGMIQFINQWKNGRIDELKSILALMKLNVGGITPDSCVNIYQYAIAHSNQLVDVLVKDNLLPVSFYKSEGLAEIAVEHKNYHFIRQHMQKNSVDTAAKVKLLNQAARDADFNMASLILNYLPGNTPLSSCGINEHSKKMEKYPVNPVTARKFQNNLFQLFKGSRYDEKSVVYKIHDDCMLAIRAKF